MKEQLSLFESAPPLPAPKMVSSPPIPEFTCSDCKLACFIEEHGYAFGHDDEPINCRDCGKLLGEFRTTGYVRTRWKAL